MVWVISRISSHHFIYFSQLTCDIAIYLQIYVGKIRFVTIQELIDKVGTFKRAIDKFGGFLISWICIKYFGGFKNMVLQQKATIHFVPLKFHITYHRSTRIFACVVCYNGKLRTKNIINLRNELPCTSTNRTLELSPPRFK